MNYRDNSLTQATASTRRPPWLVFSFLALVFFLAYHDLGYSLRGIDNYNRSQEDLVSQTSEGSLDRQVAFSALGLFAIVILVRRHKLDQTRIDGTLAWMLVGFTAWALLSILWAEDFSLTLKRLAVFSILCLAAVALARLLSLREIILWTLFTTALFLIVGIVAELAFGAFHPFLPGYRFAGTLHPNGQATDCGLLLLSGSAAALTEKRWRALFWSLAALGLVFLVLTGSRTAFAAALLATGAYFVFVSSRITKLVAAFSFSIALWIVVVIGGAAAVPNVFGSAMLGRSDGNVDSLNGRNEIWEECALYVAKHPITGYGFGGFWTPTHIEEFSRSSQWGVGAAHSAYLDCLLELGIVGLIGYTLAILLGIRRAVQLHTHSRDGDFLFLGVVLLFCGLDGLLESIPFTPTLLLFVCSLALARLAMEYIPSAIAIQTSVRSTAR